MKKTSVFFYVLFGIIIVGTLSFLLLERGEKLKISYSIQNTNSIQGQGNNGDIYQEILINAQLPIDRLDYEVNYFETYADFEKLLSKIIKSRASNVVLCDFEKQETYEAFLKANKYISPLYITSYVGDKNTNNQQKDILYLFPSSDIIVSAINQLFDLNDNHIILLIHNQENTHRYTVFQEQLKGQKTTVKVVEENEFQDSINLIGDILSKENPDYILIDLNEKSTIALLEKIVGFPRDKIILMFENTSERVAYYSGSNSYGVNGITFKNPAELMGYNNKTILLEMVTQTLAQCFVKYKKADINHLKQYLYENPSTPFRLIDHSISTPIYKVTFTERGLKVIDKMDSLK
ncbi:MAG: hypothetical protein U9N62_08120 [Thermotogota bacterium]|nr:hypothetical protein [Thermotogota bacterium]